MFVYRIHFMMYLLFLYVHFHFLRFYHLIWYSNKSLAMYLVLLSWHCFSRCMNKLFVLAIRVFVWLLLLVYECFKSLRWFRRLFCFNNESDTSICYWFFSLWSTAVPANLCTATAATGYKRHLLYPIDSLLRVSIHYIAFLRNAWWQWY